MPIYADRLRHCTMCAAVFESSHGAEVCSRKCRSALQAKLTF